MVKFKQRKVNKITRIEVESELLELNPLLNLPIRKGKFRSKHICKRPTINEWYKKIY